MGERGTIKLTITKSRHSIQQVQEERNPKGKKHPSDTVYVCMHDTEIDRDAANTNFLHNSQAERLGTT
jgi:hypothetical protein